MKLLRYGPKGQEKPGALDAFGNVRSLSAYVPDVDGKFLSENLDAVATFDPLSLPLVGPAETLRIAAPVAKVGKIVCVGLNYSDHAAEAGTTPPPEPILFMKATSAINGPNDDVVLPPASRKGDWEVELGVVIAKEARYVPVERAMEHVAGFCIVNDISEREYQLERAGQWDKGKGCDSFAPIGPWLVTRDEVADFRDLGMWLDLNGERMQTGNTSTMIFDVPFLVHYISQFMSLQPGDIISTGTPPGVGMGKKPQRFLAEGDVMTLGIDGLGEQRSVVRRYGA